MKIVLGMARSCKANQQLGFSDSTMFTLSVVSFSRATMIITVRPASNGINSTNTIPPFSLVKQESIAGVHAGSHAHGSRVRFSPRTNCVRRYFAYPPEQTSRLYGAHHQPEHTHTRAGQIGGKQWDQAIRFVDRMASGRPFCGLLVGGLTKTQPLDLKVSVSVSDASGPECPELASLSWRRPVIATVKPRFL